MKRGSPIRRGGPLRKRGARAEREAEALDRFRDAVLARAGDQCERCAAREPWVRIHAHHKLPRARGGTHDPANGAALCATCHAAVHDMSALDWRRWTVTRK